MSVNIDARARITRCNFVGATNGKPDGSIGVKNKMTKYDNNISFVKHPYLEISQKDSTFKLKPKKWQELLLGNTNCHVRVE